MYQASGLGLQGLNLPIKSTVKGLRKVSKYLAPPFEGKHVACLLSLLLLHIKVNVTQSRKSIRQQASAICHDLQVAAKLFSASRATVYLMMRLAFTALIDARSTRSLQGSHLDCQVSKQSSTTSVPNAVRTDCFACKIPRSKFAPLPQATRPPAVCCKRLVKASAKNSLEVVCSPNALLYAAILINTNDTCKGEPPCNMEMVGADQIVCCCITLRVQ